MQCNRSLLLIARPQINSNIHGLIITNEEVALIATATRLYKYLYSLRFCVEGKARFIHATCVQYITNESGEAREMVEPKWNCIILMPIDKRAKCANLERCGYLNVYLGPTSHEGQRPGLESRSLGPACTALCEPLFELGQISANVR